MSRLKAERDKVYELSLLNSFTPCTNACEKTHRGAKVVSYFMCKRDMGDFGRYVGGVVLYSDYTRVQRLLLSI